MSAALKGFFGSELRLRLSRGTELRGVLQAASSQWLLLQAQRSHIVALSAVHWFSFPDRTPISPAELVASAVPKPRIEQSLPALLDEFSRRRLRVRLADLGVGGRIDAVGADFFVLAHERGSTVVSLRQFEVLEVLDERIEL